MGPSYQGIQEEYEMEINWNIKANKPRIFSYTILGYQYLMCYEQTKRDKGK